MQGDRSLGAGSCACHFRSRRIPSGCTVSREQTKRTRDRRVARAAVVLPGGADLDQVHPMPDDGTADVDLRPC